MGAFSRVLSVVTALVTTVTAASVVMGAGSWCVARSDASQQALQTALDYACGAGADCTPIQSSGLCFLPNTLQAHASYAFNSYFQRKAMAPGACDFSGTATIAKTDPSYGSCVYPSSPSTAGGTVSPVGGGFSSMVPPPPAAATFFGNGGLTPVGMGPGLESPPLSKASVEISFSRILFPASLFILNSFIFQPMLGSI